MTTNSKELKLTKKKPVITGNVKSVKKKDLKNTKSEDKPMFETISTEAWEYMNE